MHTSTILLGALASIASLTTAQSSSASQPVVFSNFSTVTDKNLTFGKHYAVLNLDLINGLVAGVANTTVGDKWIASTAKWIDAVHALSPPPLSIFSRIYFSNSKRPEIGPQTPFGAVAAFLPGNATEKDTDVTGIYPAFKVLEDWDVVVQKTRYYAGFGNQLEEVLRSQLIDTVILSGIRTSGVILNTAYDLFNQNYNVYVIADTCIETAPDMGIDQAIKQGILPKLPAQVITLDQALAALKKSKNPVY